MYSDDPFDVRKRIEECWNMEQAQAQKEYLERWWRERCDSSQSLLPIERIVPEKAIDRAAFRWGAATLYRRKESVR